MNPFNLLINYVIANSRASFYNVPGNQEITNTALLTGMVSENPLMSYLIIDNKAKVEGEKFSTTAATAAPTPEKPPLPPASGSTNQNETPMENNKEILKAIRDEISENKTALANITTQFADLKSKITNIEEENKKLNQSISDIHKKLTEISKEQQTPDIMAGTKNVVAQKAPPKTDTK